MTREFAVNLGLRLSLGMKTAKKSGMLTIHILVRCSIIVDRRMRLRTISIFFLAVTLPESLYRMTEGCVRIFRAYTRSSVSPASPGAGAEGGQHLGVSLGDLAPVSAEAVICCQLWSERREAWASERWCALRPGASSSASAGAQITLFTDVGGSDLGPDLHCVVTVYRLGKIMNQQVDIFIYGSFQDEKA